MAPADPLGAPRLTRSRSLDWMIIFGYVFIAFWLYRALWLNLGSGYLVDSSEDQNLFEWFFAVQAKALATGHLTLFSTLQNYPLGVNLMGNTAMPGLAVPLAPLTWAFGPTLSWVLILTGGLAGTAAGWYLIFSRYLTDSRFAAAAGGGFCAFAPPVISHAVAHPNFTAMFLLPAIVWWLLRLAHLPRRNVPAGFDERPRPMRDGLVLGVLVGWQVLIGEEPLLIMATGLAVFVLAAALVRPTALRTAAQAALPGIGFGALVSVLLVAYPLLTQFGGPASYYAIQHGPAGNDLGSFIALPRQSLGGVLLHPGQIVDNPTEQNSFFGWPVLALLAVCVVWLWRQIPARLASITMVGMLALSLGTHLYLNARDTGIVGPWSALGKLPLYESLIEARMSFAALPAMGLLLALATDRALAATRRRSTIRYLWFAALAFALVPILPIPYTVRPRPPTPTFFADGAWRDYVRAGHTMVTVPLPAVGSARALHWQVVAGLGFSVPEGYFVGPTGPGNKQGMYGTMPRPTSRLLTEVARTGAIPSIGPAQRTEATADLRYWQADAIVLPLAEPNSTALRLTLDQLLGPGTVRNDVMVWPLHSV